MCQSIIFTSLRHTYTWGAQCCGRRHLPQQSDFTALSHPTGIPGDYPPSSANIPTDPTRLGVPSLDRTVHSLTSQGLSSATAGSYGSGVRSYLTFCAGFSLQAFPLSELVLCHFVAFLVHESISYGTIRMYLCAIRHRQLLRWWPRPCVFITTPPPLCSPWLPPVTAVICPSQSSPNHPCSVDTPPPQLVGSGTCL